MELRTGDIIMVDTEGFIPSKIDWFQGDDDNHTGLVVKVFGKVYIFEAISTGVAFTPLLDYKRRLALAKEDELNISFYRHKDEDMWKHVSDAKLMNLLLPLTKYPYGYSNLLFFQAIRYIAKKLKFKLWIGKGKDNSDKSFICGKLVMYVYFILFGMFEHVWYEGAPVDIKEESDIVKLTHVDF